LSVILLHPILLLFLVVSSFFLLFFFIVIRISPTSTLFPYTTLFRSVALKKAYHTSLYCRRLKGRPTCSRSMQAVRFQPGIMRTVNWIQAIQSLKLHGTSSITDWG